MIKTNKVSGFLKENWAYICGSLLVIALFFVRLINLTKIPVFADEAIYIRWSQVMRAEQTLRFLPLSDGKQPLFMWVVIPFLRIFANPLFAGRFVSVVAGMGSIVGITILSYLIFRNKTVSLISAFLYAFSPFTFFFDRMALADAMLSMFGIWTFVFGYLAFKKQRLDFAMLAGFALGGAWLTKSPALFFALMLPTLWLFSPWKRSTTDNIKVLINTLLLTLATVVIGFGFYNILRLGPNFHLIASRNMDYVYPISHILERPLDPLVTFIKASFKWIWVMGPLSILIMAVLGMTNIKRSWKEIVILTLWFLLPLIVECEFAKTLTARYILYTLPYLIVLASSVFIAKKRIVKKAAIVLVVIFVVQSSIFVYKLITNPGIANLPRVERAGYLEEWTAGQGISETANYLIWEYKSNSDKKIIIGTEGYFGTLPDGLQMYLNNYPEITAIGVGLGFSKLPTPLFESQKAGNLTYFLVNASRFGNTAENLGIKLIREFPKEVKPDGSHDSLLLFEVTDAALTSPQNLVKD